MWQELSDYFVQNLEGWLRTLLELLKLPDNVPSRDVRNPPC